MDHLVIEVTSGHLWLHLLSIISTQNTTVHVQTLMSDGHTRHHGMWVKITSVTQVMTVCMMMRETSGDGNQTIQTYYGMGMGVAPAVAAAHLIVLHTSASN